MQRILGFAPAVALVLAGLAFAGEPAKDPLPTPLTRPDMKQALEDLKGRKPRIPLPELTAEDKEQLGERATSYESRLRHHYSPSEGRGGGGGGGGGGREADPRATLDYAFKTELFWIVSRTNNCLY